MRTVRNRFLLAIVSVLVLFCIASCSYSFSIKASGSLGQPVVFQFFKSANNKNPSKLRNLCKTTPHGIIHISPTTC